MRKCVHIELHVPTRMYVCILCTQVTPTQHYPHYIPACTVPWYHWRLMPTGTLIHSVISNGTELTFILNDTYK